MNLPLDYVKNENFDGLKLPPGSVEYRKRTESAICSVLVSPLSKDRTMNFGDPKRTIDIFHSKLEEDKGLVEVKTGTTNLESKYVYIITKKRRNPYCMQYSLTMNLNINEDYKCIRTMFYEEGRTGKRETLILNELIDKGVISIDSNVDRMQLEIDVFTGKSTPSNWASDPYDENYKTGLLMNQSEKEEYDDLFPSHPLTELRRFIKYIIENN